MSTVFTAGDYNRLNDLLRVINEMIFFYSIWCFCFYLWIRFVCSFICFPPLFVFVSGIEYIQRVCEHTKIGAIINGIQPGSTLLFLNKLRAIKTIFIHIK